ncbi:MAG: cytochrome c oxidase assembly protein subunit 15 [Glaciecola sp.]|jgi:cytochrome c oxidase assembly protein subunit 15
MDDSTSAAAVSKVRPAALASVIANVGIVVTGGIVRVTGSGLGCDRWPTCDGTSVVPLAGDEASWHAYIEFGNRLLTFVVLAAAVWVVLAIRRHTPGRKDLVRLGWLQPAGVFGQALLGGVTVLTDLNPLVVAAHFLLSMVVIAAAVVLLDRVTAQHVDPRPATAPDHEPDVARLRWIGVVLLVVGAAVLVLGTLVTAAGPHAGDAGTPRLGLDIRSTAFAHADAVWLLVGLTVATMLMGWATGRERVARAAAILFAIELGQGAIGYLQYATGIPPALVSLHLLGASLVWVGVLRTSLALSAAR